MSRQLGSEIQEVLGELPMAHRKVVETLAEELRRWIRMQPGIAELAIAIVGAEIADSLPDDEDEETAK